MNELLATLTASHGPYAHTTLLTCINCHLFALLFVLTRDTFYLYGPRVTQT